MSRNGPRQHWNNPLRITGWTLGTTAPSQKRLFNKLNFFDTDVCFNKKYNTWHFSKKQFNINVLSGLCLSNISLMSHKLINSIEELSQIPESDICDALSATLGHFVYPYALNQGDYVFTEIILKHEEMHIKEIEDIFSKYLPDIRKDLEQLVVTCDDAKNIAEAKDKSRFQISSTINKNIQLSLDDWNKHAKIEINELYTNMEEEVFNLQVEYYEWLEDKADDLGLNCP